MSTGFRNAQPAQNTLLQRGDNQSPESYTTVANVSSINGFQLSAKVNDVTSHSTGNPWRQKIPTLLDAGSITFDLFFLPDSQGVQGNQRGHRDLLGDFVSRYTRDWRLVFPDPLATTWQAQGFISKFNQQAPVDSVLKAQIAIELTGDPIMPIALS